MKVYLQSILYGSLPPYCQRTCVIMNCPLSLLSSMVVVASAHCSLCTWLITVTLSHTHIEAQQKLGHYNLYSQFGNHIRYLSSAVAEVIGITQVSVMY